MVCTKSPTCKVLYAGITAVALSYVTALADCNRVDELTAREAFLECPLKVLSDENQGGSKLVSIDSSCFTV
jgi:hypothetical protein